MIITRATEYAIRAVLFLAQQPTGDTVLKKDICKTQGVTPAFLTKIFQPLIKAGIVGSHRGVSGGFYLRKEPEEITLLQIFEAEEGPLHLNRCLMHEEACDRQAFCPVHDVWHDIGTSMRASLNATTIASLTQKQARHLRALKRKSSRKANPSQ